jgi:hypothetical protein
LRHWSPRVLTEPHVLIRRASLFVAAALTVSACEPSQSRTPSPPSPSSPGEIAITGSERLGWDQRVSADDELQQLRFGVYVDEPSARTDLSSASCDEPASAGVVSCSSPLPQLTVGRHTLALVSYYADTGMESGKSNVLTVVLMADTAPTAGATTVLAGSRPTPALADRALASRRATARGVFWHTSPLTQERCRSVGNIRVRHPDST